MPAAAVPKFIGSLDTGQASPVLRFGPYLSIWTNREDQLCEFNSRANRRSREADEYRGLRDRLGMDAAIKKLVARNRLPGLWTRNNASAHGAWSHISALTNDDQQRMKALIERQAGLGNLVPDASSRLFLEASSVAPFTTGLGNEHPLENGFAFLNPYGLPYLPGSGVKGVVRQAGQQLASGEWGDSRGWTKLPDFGVSTRSDGARAESLKLTLSDVLFGRQLHSGDGHQVRGVLHFWDVFPQIHGAKLEVEIMTPHHSHYYQAKPHQRSDAPHDSGAPNPISFLTVPPKSQFTFHVRCDLERLRRIAPQLAAGDHWKKLVTAAFEHAFDWLGFGAKTAVGYGAMQRDKEHEERVRREAEARVEKEREERKRKEYLEGLDPLKREIEEFLAGRPDKGMPEETAILKALDSGRWTGANIIEVSRLLKERMERKGLWKETTKAKNPERDRKHQNTLRVMALLQGE